MMVATLAITLTARGVLGSAAGFVAGLAFATTGLVLAYGRLVFLEPLVVACLAVAIVLMVRPTRRPRISGLLVGIALVAAIGAKLLALPAAVAILAGGAWLARGREAGSPAFRWIIAGIAMVAIPWAGMILVRSDEVMLAASTLPALEMPSGVRELLGRVKAYLLGGSDNAFLLSLPLLALALAGTLAGVASFRTASRRSQALLIAAAGWALLTLAELAVVTYRPNRYFVAALPALALLGAFAVPPAIRAMGALPRVGRGIAVAAGLALLCGPGLVATGPLSPLPPSTITGIQERIARMLPPGETVYGGLAATVAMTAAVPIIIPWPVEGFNDGDLYQTRGVRWMIAVGDTRPPWMTAHQDAWDARTIVGCEDWGENEFCVVHLGG